MVPRASLPMMKSLKRALAQTGTGLIVVCGVIVLSVALFAAVVFRWATKHGCEGRAAKFTSESAPNER
jgi:hypothetical protein